MKVTLPKAVLDKLPSPDGQGLVRVDCAIRLGKDGSVDIVAINDTPVPHGDSEEADENAPPDVSSFPTPGEVGQQMY